MLNVLIALGIFATILVFLQGCAALHRVMTPRGTDRAIERLQKWTAPPSWLPEDLLHPEEQLAGAQRRDAADALPSPSTHNGKGGATA